MDTPSLYQRLRDCKSCAERRALMFRYAGQARDVIAHQLERFRSKEILDELREKREANRRKQE